MATISSPRPQSPAGSIRIRSPSFTPTSSVRPSLDLPSNARSSSPAPSTQTQRRNRAALRDYYNLKSKNPANAQAQPLSRTASTASANSTATITSTVPEPQNGDAIVTTALDEPDFQPEPYVRSLLATSNLKTVMKVEATLISEIRNLDGERKALVYDNYSKLIKATRTIGGMRRNVDGDDGVNVLGRRQEVGPGSGLGPQGMSALGDAVDGVAIMAGELGEYDKGEEVESRRKARAEREKRSTVRWVLSGPARLSSKMKDGNTAEAETEWKIMRELLDKWQGVKGVDETRKACEEAMHPADEEQDRTG